MIYENYKEHWVCDECGEHEKPNINPGDCTCRVLWISIPPGQHIHINCPVHGRVKINGSMKRFL